MVFNIIGSWNKVEVGLEPSKTCHEESQAEAHTCFTKVNSKSTSQFVEFLNINKIFCKFFLCKNYFSKINFSLVNHILNCNIF